MKSETIHTQPGASRIVPALIEQGISEIVVTPREEIVLDTGPRGGPPRFLSREVDHLDDKMLTRVTVTGDDQPLNPDHGRALRDQCAAAGVEFVFESWGDWVPRYFQRGADVLAMIISENRKWENWKKIGNQWYCKVGRAHSGNLLDGVLHELKEEAKGQ